LSKSSEPGGFATLPGALQNRQLRSLGWVRIRELAIKSSLLSATVFSILITVSIVFLLFTETSRFFQFPGVSLQEFLTGTEWTPKLGGKKQFGIWPLISGTMLIATIAMMVALPLGLITAIFLSEYAPRRLRNILKPVLEILAGVPTVVYGFFALTFITPFLRDGIGIDVQHFNALSAGIAVGILCVPTVSSLSEDALQAVPNRLREAAYGLGGTKFDVAAKVVVPAALSGIISAFLLAIARAVGETMIVAVAAGMNPRLTMDPRMDVQTMTGYITSSSLGDLSAFDETYYSLYAVAFTLFFMTLMVTLIGNLIRRRFQEAYE